MSTKDNSTSNLDSNNNNYPTKVATNVTFQKSNISRSERIDAFKNNKQFGCTIWMTGLSSAGKTTLSFALEKYLLKNHSIATYCLDGDNIRCGLNSNLGFTHEDRTENIRRIGEVAKLFADSGIICLSSFISPFEADRERVRSTHEKAGLPFIEIYLETSLEVCEKRDIKGLYKKARDGLIKDFTGIDSVYEVPSNPEITLDTSKKTIDECVEEIFNYLMKKNFLRTPKKVSQIDNFDAAAFKERELFVESGTLDAALTTAKTLPQVEINKVELQWVQVLSEGWAYPLRGFMDEDEYLQALHFNSIRRNNIVYNQSLPIVLSCNDKTKETIEASSTKDICLTYNGRPVATMKNVTIFPHRKDERCARQFGLNVKAHPYQDYIYNECGDWLLGGELTAFERITWNDGLDNYRFTPLQLRQKFAEIKADAVFAFQLRNPIHNGHALLMKDTRQYLINQGFKKPVLLLHPLGGWTKEDDCPLSVRINQHQAVLEDGQFLDAHSTIMAIFPSPMCYAGPTEVQWHAKCRMNAGADFYIVGRDPAGMPHPDTKQDLYDARHGSRVLQMAPGLENLQIVPFKVAAYNKALKKMDYFDPTKASDFDFISGTKMRKLARDGDVPPDGFMVKNAWDILANFYKNNK